MEIQEPGTVSWFPSADWTEDSYIYVGPTEVWCSLMIAKTPGQGAFSRLLSAIKEQGKTAVVPCPLFQMEKILRKKGFVQRNALEWALVP